MTNHYETLAYLLTADKRKLLAIRKAVRTLNRAGMSATDAANILVELNIQHDERMMRDKRARMMELAGCNETSHYQSVS